jgi:hypothetical protein
MISSLELLDNRRTNEALAQTHHVSNERAPVIPNDLYCLPNSHLLEIRQLASNFIVPKNISVFFILQPVSY